MVYFSIFQTFRLIYINMSVNFCFQRFSIYRFYPDNYSLISRCKTEGVYAVKVSSSDPRLQLNTLYFVSIF